MDQVAQPVSIGTKKAVEIVVHITEELNKGQRSDLVSALENSSGITGAEFCPLRFHLMLVRYDSNVFSSQEVLNNVTLQNVSARLIGPV